MLESDPFLERLPLPFGVEVWSYGRAKVSL